MIKSGPLVITLLGPTASGKTNLAIDIAEFLDLAVINADSRQVYRGMDIGTAKPTASQRRRVVHHLIDLRDPDQPITLWEFQTVAANCIEAELRRRGIALVVGGSGLYIKAITSGLKLPAVPPQLELRAQLNALGQKVCHPLLQLADPEAGCCIDASDAVRTQRALEVIYATGASFSCQKKAELPPWPVLELGLNPEDLRQRIEQRTRQLYANGLVEETEQLCNRFGTSLPLLQTIGYGEALQLLRGLISREAALNITLRRSNRLAKRQRTWFRNQHQPYWLPSGQAMSQAIHLIKRRLM